jgi:hypothetical protein
MRLSGDQIKTAGSIVSMAAVLGGIIWFFASLNSRVGLLACISQTTQGI